MTSNIYRTWTTEDKVEGKGEEGKQNLLLQTPFSSRD